MKLSIRARLMVWNVVAVTVLTLLLGLAVSWRIRGDLVANVDRELEDRATRRFGLPGFAPGQVMSPPGGGPGGPGSFRRGPGGPFDEPPPDGGGPQGPPPMSRRMPDLQPGHWFIAQGPMRPRVFDANLKSATQFQTDVPLDTDAAKLALNGKHGLSTHTVDGEPHRIMTLGITDEGAARVVQYAIPLSETERAIAGVNQTMFGMLPFALFLAGLGGYYLTDRALRPVGSLAAAAERVSGENLAGRLPVVGKDEFSQLAGTVNSMLDRLEGSFRRLAETVEKEKRFTGDASHELRSPLTAIKANTSLALSMDRGAGEYKEALVQIDRSATRMQELIEDLLLLARADSDRLTVEHTPFELTEAIEEATRAFPRKPTLRIEKGAGSVLGHRPSVVRLFANLLSNAFRHSGEGGEVEVRAWVDESRVWFEVVDSGEGIDPEHLEHLGERFYRVDSSRARSEGGVGLGLAICRSIVESHGGALEFDSERGRGTTVRFSIPRK